MTPLSQETTRRSFVAPRLIAQGAHFANVGDTAVATEFPDLSAPQLGVIDLNPLPRIGIKGPTTFEHLRAQGWPVPEHNNTAVATSDGGELVCRLSDAEVLVLAAPEPWLATHASPVDALAASAGDNGPWPVPRRDSHCWFALRGEEGASCLQKLCGVDLRLDSFPAGSIAQTSIARLNGIVCRSPTAPDTFHILADSASAVWFWDVLLDAADEFGGGPLGLSEGLGTATDTAPA